MKIQKIVYASPEEVKAATERVILEHGALFRMLSDSYTDAEEYQMHQRELKSILSGRSRRSRDA